MEYRLLGASGFQVPVLSLGTATFGGEGAFVGLVVHLTISGRVEALLCGGHSRLAGAPGMEASAAASLLANRCRRLNRSYFVNLQANGLGCLFVSSS
jgi:hypothetical protein